MRFRRALALLAFAFFAPSAQAQSDPARLAQGTFREYLELLSLPNDSAAPADIQKNVEWLERAFQKRGFTTKQLANAGKPMLYAEWPRKVRGAKTVLFYMHLDGQPVVPSEWSQKSPWQPVVKKMSAPGAWEVVNRDLLSADAIVIHDGPRHASERPTLIFGNRGNSRVTLTVYGPKQPLHSGHYGNYVPNPAIRL